MIITYSYLQVTGRSSCRREAVAIAADNTLT